MHWLFFSIRVPLTKFIDFINSPRISLSLYRGHLSASFGLFTIKLCIIPLCCKCGSKFCCSLTRRKRTITVSTHRQGKYFKTKPFLMSSSPWPSSSNGMIFRVSVASTGRLFLLLPSLPRLQVNWHKKPSPTELPKIHWAIGKWWESERLIVSCRPLHFSTTASSSPT